MLLQSLRTHCKPAGGSGSSWKYLEALVRSPRVSVRIACGFQTDLYFADVYLILSYNENTNSICLIFYSHWHFPRFGGFTQLHGSPTLGSILSFHPVPTLLQPESSVPINSRWVSQVVQWCVGGGLSAIQLCCFTTIAAEWCISIFSPWGCSGAPLIMLDYHLGADSPYVYILRDLNNTCHIMM